MTESLIAMALHGGAGVTRDHDYHREIPHMRGLVEAGRDALRAGASALDVAVQTVAALEASGLYVAGRGSAPNAAGLYELDASLMDGATRRAGAVAALVGFESPIAAARAVLEDPKLVMLAGDGAARFAGERGLARIQDPASWFTRTQAAKPGQVHGTVGCVVRDAQGRLAAATSTGGVFDKLPGRLGDTPLIGAGTWADDRIAVSCTGVGEFFIRTAAAAQLAFRVRFAGEPLESAARAVLDQVAELGGDGGLIAIDAEGRMTLPFNSEGMKRATLSPSGEITAGAF